MELISDLIIRETHLILKEMAMILQRITSIPIPSMRIRIKLAILFENKYIEYFILLLA